MKDFKLDFKTGTAFRSVTLPEYGTFSMESYGNDLYELFKEHDFDDECTFIGEVTAKTDDELNSKIIELISYVK